MAKSGKGLKNKKVTPSQLADAYYNPNSPAAYGSISSLQKATGADRATVKRWLRGEKAYVAHTLARKRFDQDRIIVQGLNDQVSTDLADMNAYASENDGIRFLLVCVDTLSKYAIVKPLKDKKASTVGAAFRQIYSNSDRKPRAIRSDKGKEYLGGEAQRVFKELGIRHFTSSSKTKSSISERFLRTIKGKIHRHFTATGRNRYIDVLQSLVHGYNNSLHSTHRHASSRCNIL